MHDIDFDEIDRAINSAKNPRQSNTRGDTNETLAPVAVTTPVSVPALEPVAPETPAAISTTHTSAPVTTAPSPAARRSSGRFMDVVHPSSDMRPNGTSRPAPNPAAAFHRDEPVRERTAVAPVSTSVASAPVEPVVSAPVETTTPFTPPVAPIETEAPELNEGSAFHWPDPIDIQEPATQDETPEVVETLPVANDELSADAVVIPEDDDDDEDINDIIAAPLESPFLSDAKVEKRPLGAFSGPDTELPLLEDFPAPNEPHVDAIPKTPEVVEVVAEPEALIEEVVPEKIHDASFESDLEVPPELHPDLLMLDTHSQDEEDAPEPVSASNAVIGVPAAADVPTGPTSITQQYKEQPSTATQTSGAIYDTDAYHQPLAHPPKKRSSLLIIVWIVAIIIVGGGLGLAFYLFALPMMS